MPHWGPAAAGALPPAEPAGAAEQTNPRSAIRLAPGSAGLSTISTLSSLLGSRTTVPFETAASPTSAAKPSWSPAVQDKLLICAIDPGHRLQVWRWPVATLCTVVMGGYLRASPWAYSWVSGA